MLLVEQALMTVTENAHNHPFQQYKVTHYCMWETDFKRLDKIHICAFTVCTVICWQTMSLRYGKKRQDCFTALCSTSEKIHHSRRLQRLDKTFQKILSALLCALIWMRICGLTIRSVWRCRKTAL